MRSEPSRARSPLLTYGLAVLSVAATTGLKFVIPELGTDVPLVLMLAPALFSAWYGGLGAGVLAAALGTLSVHYFFLRPQFDLRASPTDTLHSLLFGGTDTVAAALMASVQSSRHKAEAAVRRIEGIHSVSTALGRTQTIQEIADVILQAAASVIGADAVALWLTSDGGGLRMMAHLGTDPLFVPLAEVERFTEMALDADTPISLAARNRTLVFVESEAEFHARFPSFAEAAEGKRVPPAFLCAPMVVQAQVIGVLGPAFVRPRRIDAQERLWTQTMALQCGLAVARSRLLEREKRARVDAEDASRAKDGFLAVFSSQLRAPLTTILGWTRTLKKAGPKDRSRCERGFDLIERSARAQVRLVEDTLDMSGIVAKRLELDMKTTDLAGVVRACVGDLRVEAAAEGIDLELGSVVEATVVADAERVRQALHKIVVNAFRFTPSGGHVRVEMGVDEQCAFVRVRDHGREVDAAALSRAFEAFRMSQYATTKSYRGLGLGLAIANYIVQENRGALRAESLGPGSGIMIAMELPLAEPAAAVLARSSKGARPVRR